MRSLYLELQTFLFMKYIIAFSGILLFIFTSCKDDDRAECRTCNSEETLIFELCKESNGNASINGQDTGVKYAVYFEGLVNEGVSCN